MTNAARLQDLGFIFFEMPEDVFIVINSPQPLITSQREYLDMVFRFIKTRQLCCLSELYYCAETAIPAFRALRTEIQEDLGTLGGTCSFVQGRPIHGQDISGYVIHAAKTGPETYIQRFDGELTAVLRTNHRGRELHVSGVHGTLPDHRLSMTKQVTNIYRKMDAALAEAKFSPTDVIRTYFYLRDILTDYDEFNTARTEYFKQAFPKGHPFPASTGIQGNSMWKDDALLNFTALSGFDVKDIHTGRQCSASDYGKLFSRGKIVTSAGQRRAYISGTASINERGSTIFPGDPKKQIVQTLECVKELLTNAEISVSDVCWASLYFKEADSAALYAKIVKGSEFESLPGIPMIADICRDDLLFEVDLFAQAEKKIR